MALEPGDVLSGPPNQGSGGKRPGADEADKAAWVALAATMLLFGREISGRQTSVDDVSAAIDTAERIYVETSTVCHARPTKAF